MRGRPFMVVSLRAPHSASVFYHSMNSLVITMFIYVLVCTNIIVCKYLLDSLALLAFGLLPTSRLVTQ